MSKLVFEQDFEPTRRVKYLYGFLKKRKRRYPNLLLPGLFDSFNYTRLRFFFIFAIILEFVGIYMLYNTVGNKAYLFVPFFLDVLLAVLAQTCERPICFDRNRKLLAQEGFTFTEGKNPKFDEDRFHRRIILNKSIQYFLHSALLFVTFFKLSLIISYYPAPLIPKVFLGMLHVVTLLFHIIFTGAFILEAYMRFVLNSESKSFKYIKDDLKNYTKVKRERHYEIGNPILKPVSKTQGFKHSIITDSNDIQWLKTWGLFEDEDLNHLINLQDKDAQKRHLAIHGLKHQFDILEGDALGYKESEDKESLGKV